VKTFASLIGKSLVGFVLACAVTTGAQAQQTLLNASYDVAREFYKDYNTAFVKYWQQKSGQVVTINQSHDGSSKQARSVADGLEADVVTMNSANDIDFLASRGAVPVDWAKKFPNNASPTYSTMLFLVRKGNPKGIKDWDDLGKPGLQVVIVNPKTGGNGRYSYMGAWGYAKKKGMSDADASAFVGRIFKNVPVLDTGGRGATTTFLQRNIGDVLVTFESEVVQVDREFGAGKVDAVYPSVSVLAENPVAVIDRVVQKKGTTALANAYLGYLYSDEAQEIAAKHYLRPRSQKVATAHATEFKTIQLFTVDEMFGSWKDAQAKHFNDGGEFDRMMAANGTR
jgi:sulfate transport system substrate-binding protein